MECRILHFINELNFVIQYTALRQNTGSLVKTTCIMHMIDGSVMFLNFHPLPTVSHFIYAYIYIWVLFLTVVKPSGKHIASIPIFIDSHLPKD